MASEEPARVDSILHGCRLVAGEVHMEAALFIAICGVIFLSVNGVKRRGSESFGGISVIAGGEIPMRTPASPGGENRDLARYRRSPESRLLILND